ncbi:hypothetical protein BGZ63DRAFT_405917 [Mariannaea sp. PMI_226]|nr:hypothetical protein BGZ63DRAFT_405917 [Mariannaea sp. PMI_226]
MSLKDIISSPLEAGTSILDAHHLPPHILPALEWTSSRLARKSLHITLVVARREYQVPALLPAPSSTALSAPVTPATPGRRFDLSSGPVSALKQLVRPGSYNGPKPRPSLDLCRSGISSPAFSQRSFDLGSPRTCPQTPATPLSLPPMTPATASTVTNPMSSGMSSSTFGMALIHAGDLSEKAERNLRSILDKAAKKFRVGPEWLSPAVSPSQCGLTTQLVHGSIIQNEVLFSAEGLTLLSLDRLYSLKSALSSYSKTRSHLRLEDAVDDLRRIILARNGAKVTKSDILRSYDWLSISSSVLTDLDRMYRRAYGGPDMLGAIAGMSIFEPAIKSEWDIDVDDIETEFGEDDDFDEEVDTEMIGIALATTIQTIHPVTHSPKPLLKICTDFCTTPKSATPKLTTPKLTTPKFTTPKLSLLKIPRKKKWDDDGVEDEDLTARPSDKFIFTFQPAHTDNRGGTIDQILMTPIDLVSPTCETPGFLSPSRASHIGPQTPNGYDDISPTTRGEWGFLLVDDAFQGARTVAVETF